MDKLYPIWIKNNSEATVYCYVSKLYPDTLLPETKKYLSTIKSDSRNSVDSDESWSKVFTKEFPNDTLLIFFFNSDTINKYDWATIVKDYKVMERRTYSKSDLEESNWTITYP